MSEDLTKYLEGIDIIYWINLDRAVERRKNMEKLLSHFNIPNVRITAVDGKNISDGELYSNFIFENRKNMTKVEYSCLLSHLKTLLIFSQSNYNNALILEDDMTLEYSKYWNKTTKTIMNDIPNDWHMIMLNYLSRNLNENIYLNNLYILNKSQKPSEYAPYCSGGAYIISKYGANIILGKIYSDNKFKLLKNYCHLADVYLHNLGNTYIYVYPYFIYKTDNDSNISNSNMNFQNISKEHLFNNTWGRIETFTQNNIYNSSNIPLMVILLIIILLLIYYLILKKMD